MARSYLIASLIIFVGVIASLSILTPDIAQAQSFFDGPLVPCQGTACTICDLVGLAHNIVLFFISAATLVATLLFVYAGILYFTSGPNPEQIEQAHKIFFNVVIGLVIVLGAWLIVDTILRALPSGAQRTGVAPWADVICTAGENLVNSTSGTLAPGAAGTNGTGGVTGSSPTSGNNLSFADRVAEDTARAALASEGITVNKEPCPPSGFRGYTYVNSAGQTIEGCTDVRGVDTDVLQSLISLKKASGCDSILINGGSEAGHVEGGVTGHDTGAAVDLAPSICLNQFLGSGKTANGLRCTARTAGSSVHDTGDHYHCERSGS